MNAEEWIALAAVATCIAAPLVGSVVLRWAGRRLDPRVVAVTAIVVSLLAALVVAVGWHRGDGRPMALGSRMAGGSLVLIDGLTALLLPYLTVVDLAIVLVAPRRAFASVGVRRLLTGAAVTFAMFSTAHPAALVALWAISILGTWQTIRGTLGGQATARVYGLAMALACACMAAGTALLVADPPWLTGGDRKSVV